MAKIKLKQLGLLYFRGASLPTTIEFEPDKKITMIFGENGTGKSSIVDAFSFLCEQKFGSLEEHSGADYKCVTSICGNPEQLRVELTTTAGSWQAGFLKGKMTVEVKPNDGYPNVRILRRANILRLIEAQPHKRFEALQDYINVPGIQRSEEALRAAARDVNNELNLQVQAYTQAQAALEKVWQAEGRPNESAEKWAETEKIKDLSKLKEECRQIGRVLDVMSDVEKAQVVVAKTKGQCIASEAEYNKALSEQKEEEKKIVGQSATLLTLLSQARTFILSETLLKKCPVCEQGVDKKKLTSDLEKRIASMTALAKATTKTEQQRKAFNTAKELLSKVEENLFETARICVLELQRSTLPAVANAKFTAAILATVADDWKSAPERLAAILSIASKFDPLRTALSHDRELAQKSIGQQTSIVSQLEMLQKKRKEQEDTNALKIRLTVALEVVETVRKQFVTGILKEISDEVERLYSKLHPNEDIGGIRLTLDPKFIGSLHLRGTFHTEKDVTPQSLFSESHLDTLGLCVFLALAKKYKTDDTIVILDDVLTSVDRGHLDRFIELLHDEEEHFNQIILMTHYQPWRDRYRNHRAPSGNVHFIELRPWALSTGIRVQGMKPCLDELRQALAVTPFDRQAVASKAGIFIENVLEFLARVYACKLPLTSQTGYTLRELTDCFDSKLLKLLKSERTAVQTDGNGQEQTIITSIPLEPLITQIKGLSAVRNQVGCHYNYEASNVTDSEVEEFGRLTVTLGEALICSEGGDLPSRNRSGSYHESRSGKVRLHPFGRPN